MDANEAKTYYAIFIGAVVLALILGYFVVTVVMQQRRNLKLHRARVQEEIMIQENERTRMASDLHDELGPILSSVKLQINSMNTQDPDDLDIIRTSNDHIDSILTRIREVSNNLMPQVLLRKGLFTAIREFVDNMHLSNELKFHITGDQFKLPMTSEIHVYRALQEMIHNTVKHAQAKNLYLNFIKKEKSLEIELADDGRGFNYQYFLENGYGLGLTTIVHRIEIVNGEISIDSKPGRGTKYSIVVPT
jgi:two-component system, NarL family, sensor kinase